jgi:D-glycero-beta-D-manno-heptose 1-phosphate adenylyltransferase
MTLPSPNNFFLKRIDPKEIKDKVSSLKKLGKKIVTLNGSFDLLHAGHLEMIHAASLQGDILIVALNTDDSIRRYKNPKRPIIPLQERLRLIAALQMVDYVTWFDETDPRLLLAQICPHIHVNGAEYGPNCIEAETVIQGGGQVHIVSLVPGLSTSAIIEKIKNLYTPSVSKTLKLQSQRPEFELENDVEASQLE